VRDASGCRARRVSESRRTAVRRRLCKSLLGDRNEPMAVTTNVATRPDRPGRNRRMADREAHAFVASCVPRRLASGVAIFKAPRICCPRPPRSSARSSASCRGSCTRLVHDLRDAARLRARGDHRHPARDRDNLVAALRPVRHADDALLPGGAEGGDRPLFLVWFGVGTTPKVLIAFLISFFPIVIDAAVGLRSMSPR